MKKLILPVLLLMLILTGCEYQIAWYWEITPKAPPQVAVAPAPTPIPTPVPTPTPTPEPTPPPYDYTQAVPESEAVTEEWFADAVFIGDSRTDGLRLYSGIRGVDFICYKGLTIFEMLDDKKVILTPQGKIGTMEALAKKQYAKVYLSLGVNELGYFQDEEFADTYRAVVDKIYQLQPDADIYLQTLIPVSTEECKRLGHPSYFNNERIAAYNAIIEDIAAEKEVYRLDVKDAMVDENGDVPADLCTDGIHFVRSGYQIWYEYLKTHTITREVTT